MLPREMSRHLVADFKSIFTPTLQFTKFPLRKSIALAERETTEQIWGGEAEVIEGRAGQDPTEHRVSSGYQNAKHFYFGESHSAFTHFNMCVPSLFFQRSEEYVVSGGIQRDCKGKDKEITVGVNNKFSFGRQSIRLNMT